MFLTGLVPSLLPAAIFNGKERTRLVFDHVWWVADIGIDRAGQVHYPDQGEYHNSLALGARYNNLALGARYNNLALGARYNNLALGARYNNLALGARYS